MSEHKFNQEALDYHSQGRPGKIEVIPSKPYSSQRDLSLAYSPGVADPCLLIAANKEDVYKYTAKGNLVAVISNGTAVLGLGNIGPEASKPVMEGKGLLFKIFADIDVFDIEVNETNVDKFVETVKAISPTFGGINLEDIKAPECFEIENALRERMGIPVVALTGRMNSTLAKNSDVTLDVSVAEEACPMGLAPTASTTAALAMGDALAVALLQKRGVKEEDFAQFHPGGTLGRRLLVKVKDLMHMGTDVPRVEESVNGTAAILEMSGKKLGMTTVVDRAGALLGGITDGDIRRSLQRGEEFQKMSAGQLASRSPKTIEPDALAAKAVEIMERHSITTLVVTEGDRRIAGIIHLHDLLKHGIV